MRLLPTSIPLAWSKSHVASCSARLDRDICAATVAEPVRDAETEAARLVGGNESMTAGGIGDAGATRRVKSTKAENRAGDAIAAVGGADASKAPKCRPFDKLDDDGALALLFGRIVPSTTQEKSASGTRQRSVNLPSVLCEAGGTASEASIGANVSSIVLPVVPDDASRAGRAAVVTNP